MIPYATTLLVLGVLVVGEYFFPARPRKNQRRRLIFHLALSHFNLAVFELLLAASFLGAVEFGEGKRWGILSHLEAPSVAKFIFAVLALDLFSYGLHRLNHAVPFLWRWHRLHHSDTQIDASSALREHTGQRICGFPFELLALFLLGPPWETYVFYKTLSASLSLFHHANLNIPIRGLGNWIVVPEFHLIHHRAGGESLHFGSIFPWWDRISGTFTRAKLESAPIGLNVGAKAFLIVASLSSVSFGGSCSTAVPLMKIPESGFKFQFGFGLLACVALTVMYIISRHADEDQ